MAEHEHDITAAEFRGKLLAFIDNQEKVNAKVETIAANHIPHIFERLGTLNGKLTILLWFAGFAIPVIIGLLVSRFL